MFEIPRKIVRWHHEQPDGNGYPDGISGDDVIIECRITLVADAYDAMTSDRPYRNGLAQDVAFAELRKYAGTQFDGDVIEALYELMMPKAEPHE
jgi:HD-GYP domain-containing protein (c-di-GMP phosphodiesterase class II)